MKRTAALFVTLIMFVTIFSACGSEKEEVGDMKAGSWNGSTFKNTWSDIAVTLPDNYYAFTADEIESSIKNEGNFVYNGTDKMSGTLDPSKEQSLYDFAVGTGNQSLILGYDNLVKIGKLCSAKKYLEIVKKQILTDSSYSFVSTSTGEIAGETYDTILFTTTQDNVKVYINTYARKYGHYMVFFITSYTDDSESEMNNLLNSITKVADAAASEDTASEDTSAASDSTTSDRMSPKVQVG